MEFITDHQVNALIAEMQSMTTESPQKANLRLQNWAIFLSQYWPQLKVTWHKGTEMEAPDALSRMRQKIRTDHRSEAADTEVPNQLAFAVCEVRLLLALRDRIVHGYETDATLKPIISKLSTVPLDAEQGRELPHIPFRYEHGLLFYRETHPITAGCFRIALPRSLVKEVLTKAHDDAGHLGSEKLLHRLVPDFYWKNMRTDILAYVKHCPECLRKSTKRHKPFGSLHPLEIPPYFGHTICIDLVTDLPKWTKFNHGEQLFDSVLVATEKLTKRVKILPGRKDYGAYSWGRLLFEDAQWGLPSVIVSDRDRHFTSDFWRAFLAMSKTRSHLTTAWNPHSDGQSERMNQFVQHIMRHFVNQHQDDWADAIPFVEMAINNAKQSSTQRSPNELLGIQPRFELDLLAQFVGPIGGKMRASAVQDTQDMAVWREACRLDTIECTTLANAHAKKYYDQKHQPPDFSSGRAYVRLSAKGKGYSLPAICKAKLAPQRAGPFDILRDVGGHGLAFELDLRGRLGNIHPVISVLHLEPAPPAGSDPFQRPNIPSPVLPPTAKARDGTFKISEILSRKYTGSTRRPELEYYVCWKDSYPNSDIWIKAKYFKNADQLIDDFLIRSGSPAAAT